MAEEEQVVVRLRNDFYRDGFYKIFIALMMIIVAILSLAVASIYLYTHKPPPIVFYTDKDLRAFPPIPLTEPYIKQADLIQWVSDVIPSAFTFDFVNYDAHIKELQDYFTPKGWAALATQLDVYANKAVIQTSKIFVNAHASGAPTIPNSGLIDGHYAWWVQMPLDVHYAGGIKPYNSQITIQVLVVRVPTENNLMGILIDNVLVPTKPTGTKKLANE